MTPLRRLFKPLLYTAGVCLLVGSLLGARLLTQADPGGDPKPKSAAPVQAVGGGGPIVVGWVDSNPSPVSYGLPAAMQAGLVEKVHVRPGDKVKVGDPLIDFDSRIQKANLEQAQAARNVASAKLQTAKAAEDQHQKQIDVLKQVVDAAKTKEKLAQQAFHVAERATEASYRGKGLAENTWEKLKEEDVELFKLTAAYQQALLERQVKEKELDALKATKVKLHEDEADAGVKQADAAVAAADAALALCTVKAKEAGTVEQVVNVSPGAVLGVGSMNRAAVVLVPDGPRIVHAELEAEFAHRVGKDRIGKEVTIFDNSDSKITYKGVIRRVGDAFLDKRFRGDPLTGSDARVLEVDIEVTDAAPPNQPPLRVGQKVRVSFGL